MPTAVQPICQNSSVVAPLPSTGTGTGTSEMEQLRNEAASLRRHLSEVIRLQNEWIQLAAHELRTPLTSLHLQLELAARRAHGTSAAPFLTLAQSDSIRIIQLMDQLWKACDGVDPLAVTAFSHADLRVILRKTIRQVRCRHEASRFEVELPPDASTIDWTLITDPLRLEQVLINLCENAWKYGNGEPVRLAVVAQREEGRPAHRPSRFTVTIMDQGEGLTGEEVEKIFQKRERLAEHRHLDGSGWGLYVVRRIADALGVRINVSSEKKKGTCFELQIPSSRNQN